MRGSKRSPSKKKTVNAAKTAAKARYGDHCIVSGRHKAEIDRLDGAHIYPAGPYPEFKKYPQAIVPMAGYFHQLFDWEVMNKKVRKAEERIQWLVANSHPEFHAEVMEQLRELEGIVNEIRGTN